MKDERVVPRNLFHDNRQNKIEFSSYWIVNVILNTGNKNFPVNRLTALQSRLGESG